MYANVLLLALCQAMLMTGTSLLLAASPVIGEQLAPHPALATLPLALQYVTTMLVMIPVSLGMQRWGRRIVFVLGALVGAGGMALATLGVWFGNFFLFAAAGMLVGMHNGVGQFYRFAAAEAAVPELKSRAISLTLAGGVLAAFLGPSLAGATQDVLAPQFVASFMALCVTTLLAALFAGGLRIPATPPEPARPTPGDESSGRRPLKTIMRQPVVVVAVLTGTLGYATMSLLMFATPLAMQGYAYDFSDIASVIQWHVVAMFAPSFFTGDLIRRFGVLRVIGAGAVLMIACVGVSWSGQSVAAFHVGLILLGLGWNFLYVGATTLLTEAHRPEEKGRVQGLNDTVVFTAVAVTSLIAAVVQSSLGWAVVSALGLVGPITILVAVGWLIRWRRRQALAAVG